MGIKVMLVDDSPFSCFGASKSLMSAASAINQSGSLEVLELNLRIVRRGIRIERARKLERERTERLGSPSRPICPGRIQ